jgi:hypothetical protein
MKITQKIHRILEMENPLLSSIVGTMIVTVIFVSCAGNVKIINNVFSFFFWLIVSLLLIVPVAVVLDRIHSQLHKS